MRYATVERLVPWDIQHAIRDMRQASQALDDYCQGADIKDSSPSTCKYLEHISWELHKYANDISAILRENVGTLSINLEGIRDFEYCGNSVHNSVHNSKNTGK
jgi:hypothetical protein